MQTKSKDKTALVFGYTGLTGGALTNLLLTDDRYTTVKIFVRKPVQNPHPKMEIILDDLTNINRINEKIKGDELYCCLGTTIKKAGSKEAFEHVDLDLPSDLAATAYANGVAKFLVISSLGANKSSGNFYLKTKGRMEEEISSYKFRQVSIFRPSLLLGRRDEFRFGEQAGKFIFQLLGFLFVGPLKKYRGIPAETVARAMITVANNIPARKIYPSDEISRLGKADRK